MVCIKVFRTCLAVLCGMNKKYFFSLVIDTVYSIFILYDLSRSEALCLAVGDLGWGGVTELKTS